MKVAILGAGESGTGAALLARKIGDDPFVSDRSKIKSSYRKELVENKIRFEESGHDFEILVKADIVIKSPGISDEAEVVRKMLACGIRVISELEYASSCCHGSIIAITGTNGKTTTTNLTYHLLSSAGYSAKSGGNLGISFSRLLLAEPVDFYVLEVSSFQLDGTEKFKPAVSAILNVTPDHLDRYGNSFDRYLESKLRILENQDSNDLALFLLDGGPLEERIGNIRSLVIKKGIDSSDILFQKFKISNPFLKGRHNAINASFSIVIAEYLGISDSAIMAGLETFRNDIHRLQVVAYIDGIEWINDSKATNIEATYCALESAEKPVIWIAGGLDKGNDYTILNDLVRQKVKCLICLGVDNSKLKQAFGELIPDVSITSRMEEAVDLAKTRAKRGDVVLLSPACASFDLFENYEDRGNQFISYVWNLLRK